MHFHYESGALFFNRTRFVAKGCWVFDDVPQCGALLVQVSGREVRPS